MNPLTSSIALALGAISAQPVIAQDQEAGMTEEIIVTGVRRSLIDSAAIKRDSDGVVDALSAEDIGKFPDTNLAEALQRITGVSIDRTSAGGAEGEGQKITVRGIGPDFNLVLLNGRQMPATTLANSGVSSSRAFDFANLAAESVAGVDVYKTSMANIPTGGIGATINIRSARPLELGEQRLSLGAKAVYDTSAQDSSWTPELSGIYSGVFAEGKFGIALSAIYQQRDFGYNQAATSSGWIPFNGDSNDWRALPLPGAPGSELITNRPGVDEIYSLPQNLTYAVNEVERDRLNGQLVLQWAPTDSLTMTLDYTYSELEIQTKRNDLGVWFVSAYGGLEQEFNDGPAASPLIWSEHWEGRDIGAGGAQFGTKTELDSIGFNAEWIARDGLGFALDYHSSKSESGRASPYGSNAVLGGVAFFPGPATATVDYSQDLAVLSLDLSTPTGGLDTSQFFTGGANYNSAYSKAEVDQIDLSGYWDINDEMTLDFGVTATEVNNRSAFKNVTFPNWGGIGSPDDYPDDVWQIRDVRSLFSSISGSNNPALFNEMLTWDFPTVVALREAATGQVHRASDDFDNDLRTEEKSTSAYLQYLWNMNIGSKTANLRVGLRYEETDVKSSALVPIAEYIDWSAANEYFITFGAPDFTEKEGKYDYWLPNFDFSLDMTDEIILRASYSETIGRPGWTDIQGGTTLNSLVRINNGNGSAGDPGLLPLESTNYDLSFEWYYAEGSYFSVGYFKKDVSNYVGITQITETPFDLPHPGQGEWYNEANAATGGIADQVAIRQYIFETYADSQYVNITGTDAQGNFTGTIQGVPGQDPAAPFLIQVPSNQEDVKIDGWEIALQHLFGDSGFGVIANYTIVDSNSSYDNTSLNNQFAIEGLSDSANLVGFYDKNGWIARLAYNWRDEFLSGRFDGNGIANPIYTQEYGQLDALVSYSFNNGITVFGEAFNLTDEYLRLVSRNADQLEFVTQQGPRYGVGVRWVY